MKLKYLGHSVVIIEEGDFKTIVDPFISGNPVCTAKIEDLKGITHIFVTHGHDDHLGDTIALARQNDALVITNHEIAAYLAQFNIRTHAMHIGGRTKFDFGKVKMTPALHGSGISYNGTIICGGNPCGFVIEINGKKVYHAGDTGLTMDMKLLEVENIDVAFLPIGGNFTMDIYDAKIATEFIKAKKVVPIHYDTFELIAADPREFKESIKDSEVVILGINECLSI